MVESLLSRTGDITPPDFVIGKHVYGNLYGISKDILNDVEFLKDTMINAAIKANAKIVETKVWDFRGRKKGGVSIIILVEESHLALHTWEEYEYATLDIYTCGSHSDPLNGFYYVLERLAPKRYNAHYVIRDSRTEELLETVIKG